jgi:hypothetical protein
MVDISQFIYGGEEVDSVATVSGGTVSHVVTGGEEKSVVEQVLPDKICECSIAVKSEICLSPATLDAAFTEVVGEPAVETGAAEKIEKLETALDCKTQKCVLEKVAPKLGRIASIELVTRFKIEGPRDNELLNNVHIDSTLQQWAAMYPMFFPYNFNMLNYDEHSYREGRVVKQPDSLATVDVAQLYSGAYGRKYTCAGCVINSDRYQGPGKHWMALFVDMRTKPFSVEFFNSSGNAPAREFVKWLVKSKGEFERAGEQCEIVRASSVRHQKSRTECGLYSLFYIWSRLNGVPASAFSAGKIPDKAMFEFRFHLFDDESIPTPSDGKFNWEEYQSKVRLLWE